MLIAIKISVILLLYCSLASAKDILLISSYNPEYTWTKNTTYGLKKALGKGHDLRVLYMDTKRRPPKEFNQISDDIYKKTIGKKPDIIVLADDNALMLLGERLAPLKVPIVIMGINGLPHKYFKNYIIPKNISGILEQRPISTLVRVIYDLIPKEKSRLLIMLGSGTTAKAIMELELHNQQSIKLGKIKLDSNLNESFDEWKRKIAGANKLYDAIILNTWQILPTKKGVHPVTPEKVISWTYKNSKIPFFTTQEYIVRKDGALAAVGISGVKHGMRAGEHILKIINKQKFNKITNDTSYKLYLSKSGMENFKIKLPKNYPQEIILRD